MAIEQKNYNVEDNNNPEAVDIPVKEVITPDSALSSEIKEQAWREVPVSQLKMEDLENLDAAGQQFKVIILESIAGKAGKPKIKLDVLVQNFDKAVEGLKEEFPDATLAEILKLAPNQLREKIVQVLPSEHEANQDRVEASENIKGDLKNAIVVLSHNIESYAKQHGDVLAESRVKAAGSWFRKNVLRQSEAVTEQEQLKKTLQEYLAFLNEIKRAEKLTKEQFGHKMLYIDDVRKDVKTDGLLLSALRFGAGYHAYLKDYLEDINNPPKTVNEVIPDKIINAFRMVAGGYGAEPFDEGKSLQQFQSGMAWNSGGNNEDYMESGFVKVANVLKK